jgi:hypothetical protein
MYPLRASSLYLACKSEESHIDAEQLSHLVEVPSSTITEHEIIVLQGIRFHLRVINPYRPLFGFVHAIQEKEKKNIEAVYNAAVQLLHVPSNSLHCIACNSF